MADLGEGPGEPEGPRILDKKERKSQKEEEPGGQAILRARSPLAPPLPPFSSRSGSATGYIINYNLNPFKIWMWFHYSSFSADFS